MKKKRKHYHVGKITIAVVTLTLSLAITVFAEENQDDSSVISESQFDDSDATEINNQGSPLDSISSYSLATESTLDMDSGNETESLLPTEPVAETGSQLPIDPETETEAISELGQGVEESEVELATESEPPYVQYTMEDVRILARTAYFEMEEAINREDAEYVFKMTMSVVLNRVTAPDFPNSVYGVVFSSGYAKRTRRLVNSERVIPDILYVWAEDILKNGPNVPVNVIYQAGFKQGHGIYDVVLKDYFCIR